MSQAYQLEQSSDRYLLEDGSGLYLHELQDLTVALTGQQVDAGHGRIRADWHIDAETGQAGVAADVPLVGLSISSGHGTLTAESQSSDVTDALTGAASTTAAGSLSAGLSKAILGSSSSAESGTLTASSSSLTLGITGEAISGHTGILLAEGSEAVTDDLIELQRQRRFGQRYRTLVRSPYRRTVR